VPWLPCLLRCSRRGCWWQPWCLTRCHWGLELHIDMVTTIYELAVYQRRRSTPLLLDMRSCSCTLRHAYLHSFEAAQCKCHSWSQHGLLFRRCCNLFIGNLLRVCNHVAYLYSVQGAPHATNLPHDLPGPFNPFPAVLLYTRIGSCPAVPVLSMRCADHTKATGTRIGTNTTHMQPLSSSD
jgi:hypothetical protein